MYIDFCLMKIKQIKLHSGWLIGLKNHWDDISDEGNALTNGAIGNIVPGEHYIQTYPSTY